MLLPVYHICSDDHPLNFLLTMPRNLCRSTRFTQWYESLCARPRVCAYVCVCMCECLSKIVIREESHGACLRSSDIVVAYLPQVFVDLLVFHSHRCWDMRSSFLLAHFILHYEVSADLGVAASSLRGDWSSKLNKLVWALHCMLYVLCMV